VSAAEAQSVTRGSLVDPRSIMAVKNLELRARIVVEGFWNGIHRSPYHGFSVEFTEYRAYSPGDDLRYLDWKLLGRSDRLYIKKFEDETNLRCYLLADNSRSMTFGSGDFTKADYANTLAATIAYFLNQQGDAVGLLKFDEELRDYLPARHRHGHLRQLMHALEKPAAGTRTNLGAPLRRISELVRKRGLVVLISDLLAPLDDLEANLSLLTARGHEVVVFQVFDPRELDFGFDAASQFIDLETGQDLYIDPRQARSEYRRRFDAHNAALDGICGRLGVSVARFTTDRALQSALHDFLRERRRLGRVVRRQSTPAA